MQFNAIFTLAALAITALASPIDVEVVARTETPPPTFKCGNGQTVNCCNSVEKSKGDLLGLGLGINCLNLGIIQIPIANNNCKQTTACCSSGSQVGLINLGPVICGGVL